MDNTMRLRVIYRTDSTGEVIDPSEYWSQKAIEGLIRVNGE